jgi:hypothetical protein
MPSGGRRGAAHRTRHIVHHRAGGTRLLHVVLVNEEVGACLAGGPNGDGRIDGDPFRTDRTGIHRHGGTARELRSCISEHTTLVAAEISVSARRSPQVFPFPMTMAASAMMPLRQTRGRHDSNADVSFHEDGDIIVLLVLVMLVGPIMMIMVGLVVGDPVLVLSF